MFLRHLERGPVLFRHGLRGKEKQRYLNPEKSTLSPSFSLSLSLFSGARKEVRREWLIVWEDVRVRMGDRLF
jgi:hypothetical protein